MPSSPTLAILISLIFFSIYIHVQSSSCNENFSFMKIPGRNISNCKKLRTLDAEFGWNNHYNETQTKTKIEIFFGARTHTEKGWVAWGVNPFHKPQMEGTRALIGFRYPNGSLTLKTYNITKGTKMSCELKPSSIEVEVENEKIVYLIETGFLAISAILTLPPEYNISKLSHVWQVGNRVLDVEPLMHDVTLENFDSKEIINLKSGKSQNSGHHRRSLRNTHGILSTLGWGILLPIGVIIARYSRGLPFKCKKWRYLHISCQISAFSIGTTAWAIGIWLGNASKHYSFHIHRNLGIIIFSFAALQMLALRSVPNKGKKHRKYWNIYHFLLGYGLIIAIIVNIFEGIRILKPPAKWKWAYVGVLGTFATVALVLEALTWIKFKPKKNSSIEESS